MKKIVLFASGSGTNVENIIRYFNDRKEIVISCVLSNNKSAIVHERAKKQNVNSLTFNKDDLQHTDTVLDLLKSIAPDLIVLAGFLWKFPKNILDQFPNQVINLHPALLPLYGGKGMYGMNVHRAVVENKEKETGITIHYVNEHYDEGAIIAQHKTKLTPEDTPEDVARKIHELEYEHFPKVIEELLKEV
ncbi:phosphoribosylglycinamide formyltransferase [Gangjinia marincola]|uniref:phosphoribosylglycinamide formyltransferase n=1 Tax=Gangjinia marincola TaxID=578463 RepID=UPI0031DBB234